MIDIRTERPDDADVIRSLTLRAFTGAEHTDGDEHRLLGRLRDAGDLALSLVAEDDGEIVGHVAFSRVTIGDGASDWFGLAPVSVLPQRQRSGIGSQLILRGIDDLRASGARGIVLLGDPVYYRRFGFEHDPALAFPGPPAEYFQRLVLRGDPPSGIVRFAPAFGD